jgi:hypothetical protein
MHNRDKTRALWEQLLSLFPDEREQRLLYLSYNCGLKPMEIVRLYPQEFSSVQEIHSFHSRLLNRLQSNTERMTGLLETGKTN